MVAAGLVSEGATAKEFTDEACWWEGFVGDGGYVFEEFEQTVGFAVFFTVLGHELKERFGLLLDDGEFEEHGSVEHYVGVFLVGEYPFVLSSAYRWPATNSILRRNSTILIVSNDATQQTIISSWDIVMVV